MTLLVVEQYLDFAREIADDLVIMDRGEVVLTGGQADIDGTMGRRHPTV